MRNERRGGRWAIRLASTISVLWVVLCAAAANAAPVEWPQFHGSIDHRGVNKAEHTVAAGNVTHLSLKWIGQGVFSEFGLVFKSSPSIAGGMAYFGDTDGELYAFPAAGCGSDVC